MGLRDDELANGCSPPATLVGVLLGTRTVPAASQVRLKTWLKARIWTPLYHRLCLVPSLLCPIVVARLPGVTGVGREGPLWEKHK